MKTTPRQIAAEALMRTESRAAWSNRTLDTLLRQHRLGERDSAFVSVLVYGVLERRTTLDACIAAHASKKLEKLDPPVRAVLRLGIYQLLYMDVPDSAAVHASVETLKALRKTRAAGFVNGILRSFLRAEKRIPIPETPLSAHLSVKYSCPEPLVQLWLESYGEVDTRRILTDNLGRPPLYLRANTRRITPEELIARLAEHGIEAVQDPDLAACLVLEKAGAVHRLPEFADGLFHIQDKSSQLCAWALDAQPGMRVLDACAAPGGKTFTVAQYMQGEGEIVATDRHAHRLELLERRAQQMGIAAMLTVREADMAQPQDGLGVFDRVLCDVPCSGLGVIRRKPEIQYKNLAEFEELPELQYKILENTAQYCKAGGELLYSTCTLHPAENEDVSRRFLYAHPEFAPSPLPPLFGDSHERTLLAAFGADGFYLARFRRRCDRE